MKKHSLCGHWNEIIFHFPFKNIKTNHLNAIRVKKSKRVEDHDFSKVESCWGAPVCHCWQIKSCDKIFDGNLQVLCVCRRAWGENNTKRSPNFNINRASWLPGILKRQKFKWTSLPVIRRPESLWKMSYGYFWRTKCSVSPQGKPWIARVGITWKEGLADVRGTCHWRSVFCSQCHRSPSEETVQKDSCICESFCEKLTDACYRGEKDTVRKLILQYLIWIYCLDFGKPGLQHTLGASSSLQMSLSWMAVEKESSHHS